MKEDFRYIKKVLEDLESKKKKLVQENNKLKKENEALRREVTHLKNELSKLDKKKCQPNTYNINVLDNDKVNKKSNTNEKTKLFRSLFIGRDDVYAKRWESKDKKKSGYSPVCLNIWVDGICEKPKIKCSVCNNPKYAKLTNTVIYNHLSGNHVIGLYPLRKDNTCYFLAIDFDKNEWKKDVTSFMSICRQYNVSAVVERSRSGNGAHVWIFFNDPIKASVARRLGSMLLSKTLEHRYQLGLTSYDRLFPNQDRIPSGGFGNLIALPLQKHALKEGNSGFVDSNFKLYDDQWSFLSNIKKITSKEVFEIVKEYEVLDKSDKNNLFIQKHNQHLPNEITIKYKNKIIILKEGLTSEIINALIQLASFQNPEFYKAQALRLSTYNIPRVINNSEEDIHHLFLPRGCFGDVINLFTRYGVKVNVKHLWNEGKPIDIKYLGSLKDKQAEALRALLKYNTGILTAPTGFGKTIVAISLIAHIKKNTLIIVHTKQLLVQWKEKINAFLNIDNDHIGQYGGSKKKRTGIIDVALIQSLNYKNNVKDFVSTYGLVIVDECHHISAFSYEQVLKQVHAKYIYGFTATLIRKDGQHPIVKMQLGPERINVKNKSLEYSFNHIVKTQYFNYRINPEEKNLNINQLYQNLIENDSRNKRIINDVLAALEKNRTPLVLTERVSHLENLQNILNNHIKEVYILKGGMRQKILKDTVNKIKKKLSLKEKCVIIATGKFVGEGLDLPELDTLFLTLPISWKGTLQQYVGRLNRNSKDKQEVIVYDYVDKHPIIEKMFKRRLKGYKALGFQIK